MLETLLADSSWRDASDSELARIGITQKQSMEQISAAVSERPASDAHPRCCERSSTKQFQAFLASCDAQHTERFHQRRNLPGDTERVGVLLNLHHPQGSFVLKTEIMSQSARLRTAEMSEVHSHPYEMNNIARAQISGEVLLYGKLQPHANVVRLIAFNVAIKAVKDDLADVRVMMLTRRARLHLVSRPFNAGPSND